MTLVAFVVALGLGALLLLLATELVLTARRSLLWQTAVTRLERAGDRGLDLLASELAMAGFRAGVETAIPPPGAPGCGVSDGWALALRPSLAFADRGTRERLQLTDGTTPDCLPARYLQAGSDLLALRRAATLPTGPGGREPRGTQWYLAADDVGRGEYLYLGASPAPGDLPDDGREVREWHNAIFYVRDYSVFPGDDVPTLCVERLLGAGMRSECLVEGVERLHVVFHVDRDRDGRSDDAVAGPSAVELLSATRATVYLQVRTLTPLGLPQQARVLQLGSERVAIPADDPFLHRVYLRTVRLRNVHGGAA
ncbi:MAG: hypothetical protein ACX93N_06960 [Pseudohaliea sp.]